jgi:hypothetical protein
MPAAANAPLQPRPGFDWWRVKWGGPDDLVSEVCSYCGELLDDDGVPLRLWSEDSGLSAVFCDACMSTWWGLETFCGADDGE